jgi:streptogramin lyase
MTCKHPHSRAARAALFALAVPIAAMGACKSSGDGTAIAVHVMSDDTLGLDAVDLTAQLTGSGSDGGAPVGLRTAHFPDPTSVTWVLTPSGPDKTFSIQVVASGMKTGTQGAVVSQRAVVAFQPGRRVDVTMSLSAACVGHTCAAPLTCDQGACVDPTTVGTSHSDGGPDRPTEGGTGGTPDGGGGDGRHDATTDTGFDANTNHPIGDPCNSDMECASTHCVDNVCCDGLCGGSCQQCDSAGTNHGHCITIAAGQPAPTKRTPCSTDDVSTCHQTGLCDGKGACQLYANGTLCKSATCDATANTLTESRCDGMGACNPGTPVTCAPFRCKTGDTACARTCTTGSDCDGQPCLNNSCGKLGIGAACNGNSDCMLNHCVDKVCCDSDCTGQCQACNLSTSVGMCSNVQSGQPVGGRTLCNGSGTCGGSCMGQSGCSYPPTSMPCRNAGCDVSTLTSPANCDGAGACPTIVTNACMNHLRCQPNTAMCFQQCSANGDCVAGYYCSGSVCTATKGNGAMCAMGFECTNGNCFDSHCCDMTCNGTCQNCSTGTCSMVKNADDSDTCTNTMTCSATGTCGKKNGQTCSQGAECATGFCADGRCCNKACNGFCQVCDATGSCNPLTNQEDAAGGCSGGSYCDGTGTCQNRITEYTVPTANSSPTDITAGPDGNLWFNESNATKLGRITPAGAFFEVSTANVSPQPTLAVSGEPSTAATKRVWFITQDMLGAIPTALPTLTAQLFTSPGVNTFFRDVVYVPSSARVDMTDGVSGLSEFITGSPPGYNALGEAAYTTNQVALGPDGRVWFTGVQTTEMTVSVNDPNLGVIDDFVNVAEGSDLLDLVAGPDGNIWYVRTDFNLVNTFLEDIDVNGNVLNRITIAAGVLYHKAKITRGPGNTIFFTDGIGSVNRLDLSSQAIRSFVTPTAASAAQGITLGPDGNIWFTEPATNKIGRLVPP